MYPDPPILSSLNAFFVFVLGVAWGVFGCFIVLEWAARRREAAGADRTGAAIDAEWRSASEPAIRLQPLGETRYF